MEVAGLGGVPGTPNTSMLFLASFMTLFSIVIALFKDIPGALYLASPKLQRTSFSSSSAGCIA